MTEVLFHPDAVAEAKAARQWYADRSPMAAAAFLEELDSAIDEIATNPTRWPGYMAETRRFLFKRFPFLVVYRERPGVVEVIAIAHGHRRPGYWSQR